MEGGLKKMVKKEKEPFHVIHKVPSGDGPYVRAKHAQVCCFHLSNLSFYLDSHNSI